VRRAHRKSYMSTISSLHQSEIKDMLFTFMGALKATATGEPNEACELSRHPWIGVA